MLAQSHRNQAIYVAMALPCLVLLLGLFAFPVVRLVAFSLEDWDLKYYSQALTDPLYLRVYWTTLRIAGIVTIFTLVMGFPIAHFIATASRLWATIGLGCVLMPFWISLLVRNYAWMILLGNNGVINRSLQALGVTSGPLSLMNNELGTTIAMVHVLLPYMVFPIYAAMLRLDRSLLGAAAGLGASRWNVFRLIYIPLTLPGIAAGVSLVFILALGFFITPALLGGGKVMTITLLIEQQVSKALNWGFAAALSMILLALTLAIFAALNSRTGSKHA